MGIFADLTDRLAKERRARLAAERLLRLAAARALAAEAGNALEELEVGVVLHARVEVTVKHLTAQGFRQRLQLADDMPAEALIGDADRGQPGRDPVVDGVAVDADDTLTSRASSTGWPIISLRDDTPVADIFKKIGLAG